MCIRIEVELLRKLRLLYPVNDERYRHLSLHVAAGMLHIPWPGGLCALLLVLHSPASGLEANLPSTDFFLSAFGAREAGHTSAVIYRQNSSGSCLEPRVEQNYTYSLWRCSEFHGHILQASFTPCWPLDLTVSREVNGLNLGLKSGEVNPIPGSFPSPPNPEFYILFIASDSISFLCAICDLFNEITE